MLNLHIGGVTIKRIMNTKTLGIYIDETLSWPNQINDLTKKIFSATGSLRQIQSLVFHQTLIIIYNSLILLLVDYCDQI